MKRTIYAIHFKDTTIDEENVMSVWCGTFGDGYKTLDEAKRELKSLVEDRMTSIDDADASVHWSDGDECATISVGENTYEYEIEGIVFED